MTQPLLPRLSPAEARLIDRTCDRFEAAWKAGHRPFPGGTTTDRIRAAAPG